jgi:hypothetical protein
MYTEVLSPLLHFTRSCVSTFVKAGPHLDLHICVPWLESHYVCYLKGGNVTRRLEAHLKTLRVTDDSADPL